MRLIIIADEAVYEHEVDPSVEVQDVIALVEVETGIPAAQILLSTDTGAPLVASNKTLESYGLKGEVSTIFLSPPQGGSSQPQTSSAAGYETEDQAYERMRQQTLADPTLMSQLRQNNPDVHAAVQAGTRQFKEAMQVMQNASREKARQAELLNSDPYDIEAQKRIEEAIRRERVLENMEHAWEHAPETFGSVTMLYIPVEINGHKVKAFVDSGAQSTIISPACAEECGIMRLLDERFAAMAIGVGTARILGRIHSAQIKLGGLHLPCSFQVLEGKGVDVLFGLDMLKRYQCNIDLAANVLRIQSATVPFLPEHELPRDGLQRQAQEAAEQEKTLAGAGSGSSTQPAASGSGTSGSFPGAGNTMGGNGGASKQASGSGSTGSAPAPIGAVDPARVGKVNEEHVQTLMGLGAERQQAIALLEAAGGNVDYAASMLFGGGAQWP